MKAWTAYAGASLVLVAGVAGAASLALPAAASRAVWLSAVLAYILQLIAFAALLAVRRHPQLFLTGWVGGMGLRFLLLAMVAWWATSTGVAAREALLVSLAGYLFLLLLLEPVFLGRGAS